MPRKITHYRDDKTGELVAPHRIGESEDGRPLYSHQDGYTPVDENGNPVPCEHDQENFGHLVPVEDE